MAELPTARVGRLRRALPPLLTGLLLVVLGAYLYAQRRHVAAHYAFEPGSVLGIGGLLLASLALRAAANQQLFGRLGVSASYRDWFALVTVNSFSNYLPLSAGLVAKAFYLKRVHAMPYREFAVGQVALLVLIVAANGAAGLLCVALWRPEGGGLLAALFAGMLAAGSLLLLPATATRFAGRWWTGRPDTLHAVRRAAPAVIALQGAALLTTSGCLALGFSMGRVDVGFAACVVFSASTVLTRVVSITPGALGVREFLVGGLAVLTGFGLQDAVIASTLVRLVEMLVIFLLGGVFTYRLSGRVASTFET